LEAASPYALAPWLAQYGGAVPDRLAPPRHPSLAALAFDAAARHADRAAFTTVMPNGMQGTLRYRELDAMSYAFALYLRRVLRLHAGDRVAVQLPNCLAYPVVAIGVLKAGCVLVNTNPMYTPREMAHQFTDSGAKAVVVIDLFADKLEAVLRETPIEHVVVARVCDFFPALVGGIVQAVLKHWHRQVPRHGLAARTLPEALAAGRAAGSAADARALAEGLGHESLALLQYTGGTTGVAKGAELTHGNLLWNVAQMRAMAGAHIEDGREVVLTALPLYHVFAFTVNFLSMLEAGAHNVLVPNPRPIGNLQRAIENHRVTWITGVNTLYNALLGEEWFTAFPPKHLKAAAGGGAAMHGAVVRRFEDVTHAPLAEGYGLTECAPVVSFQPLGSARAVGGIGIPVPMTEVKLVDDAGREVALGEPGELCVRGPQVMRGYWQRPEATAEVLKGGWLHTGDVATMDTAGTLRIVDRKKDLVLVSGFNVYPNEIEDVLAAHDKVQEAAAVGVPDAKTGEAVVAFVVPRDPSLTEAELLAHCRAGLAAYKVPARFTFAAELPKSAIGKILRKELRAQLARPTKG
jgi:long-chain acyl-CoA synthetase